jgi:hypothetical protein
VGHAIALILYIKQKRRKIYVHLFEKAFVNFAGRRTKAFVNEPLVAPARRKGQNLCVAAQQIAST